ncbi:MAG: hypothetical protein IID17_04480 [Nitrospinae bacterium]|nr:hypothetical protein [Nitrospinota bacterium]
MIEGKGQDAVRSPNSLHILIASNKEWVIPAGIDERRFFCLEVGNKYKQKIPYFKAIKKPMENGGYAAMLYELLNRDISDFEVRDFPRTKLLQAQIGLTMEPHESFFHHLLQEGEFPSELYNRWDSEIPKRTLYDCYLDYCRDIGVHGRKLPDDLFGKYISKIFKQKKFPQGLKKTRPDTKRWKRGAAGEKGYLIHGRMHCYIFPELKYCRKMWDSVYGKMDWPEIEENVTIEMDFGEDKYDENEK